MNFTTIEKLELLRSTSLFRAIPAASVALIAEMMQVESFVAGDIVCEAGEPATCIYVIASGELAVSLPERSEPVRLIGRGEVVGEYGMFGARVRTSRLVARAETALLSLDYERFRELLLLHPESTLALLEVTVSRLVAAEAKGA